ncbi:RNA polymerase factor sigma-54 [Maricaulis sp.]|uniref:RNA polymerase factor sigma-54 n=1 Tax=Maricaulis sp. TaxID=1486257 RepID=UPI001B1CF5DA|nr:RNA polymerase factor sigma-54 [Maricaulis sp.]MBO6798556.1 RNA polymerase factor sigma-54 [Maricaulis sp.]
MNQLSHRFKISHSLSTQQTISPELQRSMYLLGLAQDDLEREVAAICEANPLIAEMPTWARSRGSAGQCEDRIASMPERRHLGEDLKAQLGLVRTSAGVRHLACMIIDSLDPTGRLDPGDWERIEREYVEAGKALQLVQSLEPAGVASRNLPECFWLQLDPAVKSRKAWRKLFEHLAELHKVPASAFARLCDVDEVELRDMLDLLRQLDPTPGLKYDPVEPIEVRPDLVLRSGGDGDTQLVLARGCGPRLSMEVDYRNWRSDRTLCAEAHRFLESAQLEVNWLQQALRQRGAILLRVGRLLVRRQYRFLEEGDVHLIPLTMREVAAELGVHESTISRAVAHKYILTRRGVLALRQFFSVSVDRQDEGREASSSTAVRAHINRLIREEAVPGEMSDALISSRLGAMGIAIARRSVAKHRKQLGISCSRDRYRWAGYGRA